VSNAIKNIMLPGSLVLEQISGKHKGRVFELSASRTSIGRGDENEICLRNESVSRLHAIIEPNERGQFTVQDQGSRNGIQVNGETVHQQALSDGDMLQIGSILFKVRDPSHDAELLAREESGTPMLSEHEFGDIEPVKYRAKPNRRVLIYALVGVGLWLVWYGSNEKATVKTGEKDLGLSRVAALELTKVPEIPVSGKPNINGLEDPLLSRAEHENSKIPWSEQSVQQAEQLFRRGQREYFNHNYHRAMESFNGAMSINALHPLAASYLARAKQEAEIEAQKNWEIALKYFDSLNYERAIYHFDQVIANLQHRTSEKMVEQSREYIRVGRQRMLAGEAFP